MVLYSVFNIYITLSVIQSQTQNFRPLQFIHKNARVGPSPSCMVSEFFEMHLQFSIISTVSIYVRNFVIV